MSFDKQKLIMGKPLPSLTNSSLIIQMLSAVIGTVLLTMSAKISVPFYPVPMTFQTLVVLILGMVMGPRLAGATLSLYLMEGAVGLPVFAGTPQHGFGVAYMMGPTGGFLIGFLIAALLSGWLLHRCTTTSLVRCFWVALAGTVAIYVPGLLWLGSVAGWDKPILQWGLYPFLASDLLKLTLVTLVAYWINPSRVKPE